MAKPDLRFARAFTRVGRVVLGGDAFPAEGDDVPFDRDVVQAAAQAARRTRAQSSFAEALLNGQQLEIALLSTMRQLMAVDQWHHARALADALGRTLAGDRASRLGLALAAHRREWFPLAYEELAQVADGDVAEFLPIEGVEICLRVGTDDGVQRAKAIGSHRDRLQPAAMVGLAGRFVAVGELELARQLADHARQAADVLDEEQTRSLDVLGEWLDPLAAPSVPSGTAVVGVIDYHQPDQSRASRNVGDYIQTLAMLGNLARFTDIEFGGDERLGEVTNALKDRVRPELRLRGLARKVQLVTVNRDFSNADAFPDPTFMVAFGWHMHSLFGIRHDFPYHPNVRPIFVSLHINRTEMLSDAALEYLRRYGPVGCRDWTTVDLLLSAGVDAFFTGCLTTTVNAVFPPRAVVPQVADLVGLVDAPPGAEVGLQREHEVIRHGDKDVRSANLAEGVEAAVALLERYQSRFHRLVTTRLHSYLPATSLEVPVRFVPANPSDIRFDGLLGMQPEAPEFVAIRDGIRALLREVFGLIASGAGEDEVYARWREITADKVAAAKVRHSAATANPGPADLDGVVADIGAKAQRFGPHDAVDEQAVTDVALSLDQNLAAQFPVTVEAMTSNASGPLRLWVTCRGLSDRYLQWVGDAFPDVPITFLPCDDVDYGDSPSRLIEHTTVTTLDRLLLPELLPTISRITYIDIDAVVLGDVCELAATDLGGHALAARSSARLAVDVWWRVGDLLPPDRASELRRRMAGRFPFGYKALNAGIMVLDLDRMRADRFSQTFVPWVSRYGLNDQDVMLAYVGPDRAELEPRWNTWPVIENVDHPAIVHYLGPLKPWGALLGPAADVWQRYEAALAARVGSPAT